DDENAGSALSVWGLMIDARQASAAAGDTLNTALKSDTGTHQLTVQSLDGAGNFTASGSLNVVAEPGDIPPVAKVTLKPLTGISPTTFLGCAATSDDADGFVSSYRLQFSDGSKFTTPAAVETFP